MWYQFILQVHDVDDKKLIEGIHKFLLAHIGICYNILVGIQHVLDYTMTSIIEILTILEFFSVKRVKIFFYTRNGWILLNVGTIPKILHFLIKVLMSLCNVRFSASFRRLEESTQYHKLLTFWNAIIPVVEDQLYTEILDMFLTIWEEVFFTSSV